MNIQFAPHLKNRSLYQDLDSLFRECTSFKASLAYWTIFPDFFKKSLTNALKKPNSFVCLDLSEPTRIDAIKSFCIDGAEEFYWHKYRLRRLSNYRLLHSKVLLFDLPNGDAEIWIGSMNFTLPAIKGHNIESISKIQCAQGDAIYNEALEFLLFVKNNLCFKFDPDQLPYYQMLNGETVQKSILKNYNSEKIKVISLFGENINLLKDDEYIELLSFSQSEFNVFKTEKKLFLLIADLQLQKEYLFEATVEQVGKIDQGRTFIDFIGDKRYAYIGLDEISYLQKPTNITHELQKDIQYFVTLKIKQQISEFSIFEYPNIKSINTWENDGSKSYARLLNITDADDLFIDVAKSEFIFPECKQIRILDFEKEKLNLLKNIKQKLEELKDLANGNSISSKNPEYFKSSLHSLNKLTIIDRMVIK